MSGSRKAPRGAGVRLRALVVTVALVSASAALLVPGSASGTQQPATPQQDFELLDDHGLGDMDARAGIVKPTADQISMTRRLGATRVSWNRFGTPHSMIKWGGYLASGLSGDAVAAARTFVRENKELFRLSDAGVDSLELLNDSQLVHSDAHVVMFRQRFGNLAPTHGGLITVGITNGNVAYVSSSSAGDGNAPADATLSPAEAWGIAARHVGHDVAAPALSDSRQENGWTIFDVQGFNEGQQRVRLVAMPTPRDGVRPAYEANVVLSRGTGHPSGYTVFVDARSGEVMVRVDRLDTLALAAPTEGTFAGSTGGAGICGPNHEFNVPKGTRTIDVVASADVPLMDIVLNLIYVKTGTTVASFDSAFSPEAIHYNVPEGQFGTYAAQVCPFEATDPAFPYHGAYFTQDAAGGSGFPYPPVWAVFPNTPPLDHSDKGNRERWCWVTFVSGVPVPDCQRHLQNLASRAPWDFNPLANVPTFTTYGNNAISGEAWLSPLTPAEQYRPVSHEREYVYPWTNQWFNEKCNVATSIFSPQRNDIDAATTNLFAMHNRMHDWSYFLGFTEENFNMQLSNFGNGGLQGDPEVGNAQAGALPQAVPGVNRDNANQVTLQDGVIGDTNMYLWQPFAGLFYAPCVDGDYDMTVIGHEYTHAISNRMAAGPDSGLGSGQSGAMGESWSDLVAVEHLAEVGFKPAGDASPWAVGPYVTGNPITAIRNFNMSRSPLNFSDVSYDLVGFQTHADGEIWTATNFQIRKAMNEKFNDRFPAGNPTLQRRCAEGNLPPDHCPGNRRWIQLVFDAWLLMPADVSMVDARDAMLAADVMRFGGSNQELLWRNFAKRGFGQFASSKGNTDQQPIPSFESPLSKNEAVVTFEGFHKTNLGDIGSPINVKIYVGDFEARATPIADTDPKTKLPATVRFMPGGYQFVAQADGYGLCRFKKTFSAGQVRTLQVNKPKNFASVHQGATATGEGVNLESLIDDTEATNWAVRNREPSVVGATVTVDLAGDDPIPVQLFHVSAALRPADPDNEGDPGGQNRFSALRQFEILVCNANKANCSKGTGYTSVLVSPEDAFPTGFPRPIQPNLIFRRFTLDSAVFATHVRLKVLHNQCTGNPAYQGDQDDDPLFNSDCDEGSGPLTAPQGGNVRAAELEVFSVNGGVTG